MKDIERDLHLSAALRHAPDAGLSAPPDISALILAAAHRAAAERAPPAPPRRKRGWLGWFGWFGTPWRLGASGAYGAFASLALAGVIGLLWRGEPTPGAAPERVAEAVPAAASAAPLVAPAAVAADAPPAPTPATARAVAVRAAAPAASSPAEPAPIDAPAAPAVMLSEAMPAPTPMPTPMPMPPLPAPAPAADTALGAAAEAPAQARAARPSLLRADAENQGSQANRQAAPAAIMAVPRPQAPWMDALAAGKAVQWRIDGQARAPTSSWLYALAEQTQGRWRTASGVLPAQADNEVQWWREGALQGRFWLGAQRVLWCTAQGACEEAPLDVDVPTALRKELAR